MPIVGNVFSRIWKFADQFAASDTVDRADLDTMADDLAVGVNAALQSGWGGTWQPSLGAFPIGASAGRIYLATDDGTVGGVAFGANDLLLAIADAPSTSTYANNWLRITNASVVESVAGLGGAVTGDEIHTAIGRGWVGTWAANTGNFPSNAKAGAYWLVSVGGILDGETFVAGDLLMAVVDNASTTTYEDNWQRIATSDPVRSVAGLTGALGANELLDALYASLRPVNAAGATDGALVSGLYSYGSAYSSGGPAGATKGALIHLRRFGSDGETQIFQELEGNGTQGDLYVRGRFTSGAWGAWRRMLAFDHVLDEDTFASHSATQPPSQQSVAAYVAGRFTLGAARVTTSGTEHDYTTIPSWVKRITINIAAVSTDGTSPLMVRIGDSGGIESTGYSGAAGNRNGEDFVSTGAQIGRALVAGDAVSGRVVLSKVSGNTWVIDGSIAGAASVSPSWGAYSKTLSAALERVRITTAGGTDVFDAGSLNITYE